jgi:hypothetical protein
MNNLPCFTDISQETKPTRVMFARREFRKAYIRDSRNNEKIYKFLHGKMSMQTFIERAYESGISILDDRLNQPKNLTWEYESIGLTNSAYKYYCYLVNFEE